MADTAELRRYTQIGVAAMLVGAVAGIAGALFAHFTGLPTEDALGQDLYPAIPRGWLFEVIGQLVSLGGGLLLMAGVAVGFLYRRPMTWARAAIGASLFTTLMMILFGIVPNQWLTLTQSVWEWTPQKKVLTIPSWLVLNNEVEISAAAVKDLVSGTYVVVALGAIAVAMYQWQERQKRAETGPPPQPVSTYGRPLTKVKG
jgi:hypothetical protein